MSQGLHIGTAEQRTALEKLQPTLPNHAAYKTEALIQARVEYTYLYVINWIHHYRGYVRLLSEYFDIDIFELELLGYFPRSHTSEPSLFSEKLRLALMSIIHTSKVTNLNEFERVFRASFGDDTPLGPADSASSDDDFASLDISSKFTVFFMLINRISRSIRFRDYIDKNQFALSDLRITPIVLESTPGSLSDIFVLGDSTRIYRRTVRYPKMEVPKRRKDSPEDPDAHYIFDVDIADVSFEVICAGIFEFDAYIQELAPKKSAQAKSLRQKLTAKKFVELVFTTETKARRFLANKRREIQLETLLATRKKSSRLEAKEHKRQEEEQRAQQLREEEERAAAQRSLERRREASARGTRSMGEPRNLAEVYSGGLSRDERLRQRQELNEAKRRKLEENEENGQESHNLTPSNENSLNDLTSSHENMNDNHTSSHENMNDNHTSSHENMNDIHTSSHDHVNDNSLNATHSTNENHINEGGLNLGQVTSQNTDSIHQVNGH